MKIFYYPILVLSFHLFGFLSFAEDISGQKAVLVTGASSGIGLRIAETLAENGYYVYAGARKQADLKRLDAIENMSSVMLDVTKQEDINAAVDIVSAEGRGLWGIVNNAGVLKQSQLTVDPIDDVRLTFDVNVFGPVRVNSAFLPLMEKTGGRIVTISSLNGFAAVGGDGGYSASKFAVEGYMDSLAAELADTKIHVSVVQPGQYKSKIRGKMLKRLLDAADAGEIKLDPAQRAEMVKTNLGNNDLKEPDEVAEAVLDIVSSDNPKRRYLVTPNKESAHWAIGAALQRVVELNEDHSYSYTPDQLAVLLDEMMDGPQT